MVSSIQPRAAWVASNLQILSGRWCAALPRVGVGAVTGSLLGLMVSFLAAALCDGDAPLTICIGVAVWVASQIYVVSDSVRYDLEYVRFLYPVRMAMVVTSVAVGVALAHHSLSGIALALLLGFAAPVCERAWFQGFWANN